MKTLLPLLGLCLGPAVASNVYDFTVHLPEQRPEWVERLSPHLAGFSIEMDRWPYWAGHSVGQPNEYFNQLLQNLADRTGRMPFLRVGANSQDRSTVDLNVEVINSTYPEPTENVPNPEAEHNFIGRDFYALSANLPAGTPFMWGLNLKDLNKTETVIQARLLAETFQGGRAELTKHVNLVNVEIGNEPDFYGPNRTPVHGPLDQDWDIYNYTQTWKEFARAIGEEIDFGPPGSGKPSLSPGALTSFYSLEWSPQGALIAGLLDDSDLRPKISQFTGHAYSGGFSPNRTVRPGELMDKLSVRANFTTRTDGRDAVRSVGLKYQLAETNSYANHGQPGLSNTVESALWTTDWLLLSAASGVERVHLHQGNGFRYNAIQPSPDAEDGLNISEPHILPSYYSLLIVDEAIGKSDNAYIAEIPTTNITLTAYGIWEQDRLSRLVVLNTQVYLGTGERPSINVNLSGLYADKPAKVKFLRSGKTTDSTGLTWAGQSFETLSGKPEGYEKVETVKGGHFNLPASSIALIIFEAGE